MTEQAKFGLDEISKIEDYFIEEINQRKSCSKKWNKILIVLSATSCGAHIIYFVSAVGAPVGIAGASFTLIFSLTTGIIKKLLSMTRKKKHDKILMLLKVNLIALIL